MSLVCTYVESQEGHWYQDPVARGPRWFICWDDDDPIELVIEADGPTPESILATLAKAGWKLTITSKGLGGQRVFGEGWNFKPAKAYFLRQLDKGPTDAMLSDCKRLDKRPTGQGVYYSNSKNGNRGKA